MSTKLPRLAWLAKYGTDEEIGSYLTTVDIKLFRDDLRDMLRAYNKDGAFNEAIKLLREVQANRKDP